jgi:two-component system chemotaxis response regulator CheB
LIRTPSAEDAPIRDIVLVGGSAGSLESLRDIVSQLPSDCPLAIFVVVHVLPTGQSRLPQILSRTGSVPARHAREGDHIEPGRILVAPPDRHLLLDAGGVHIDHGPRENSTRPALDPLFRSAATAFGPRVCGVVLSGHLDDGSEGLRLLAAAGGLAIVQDPDDAPHPEMPRNALRRVPEAQVLTAAQIGKHLASMPRRPAEGRQRPAEPAPPAPPPLDVQIGGGEASGVPSGLTCPECGGVLWAEPESESMHCRVGHRYGLDALWNHKNLSVEQSGWAAVRALQEDASLAEHLAERAREIGSQHTAARFGRRHRDATRQAEELRRLLLERDPPD